MSDRARARTGGPDGRAAPRPVGGGEPNARAAPGRHRLPAAASSGPDGAGDSRDRFPIRWDEHGLIPGIVQDAADGTVLMVGYLDGEALAATRTTGLVHFHSRSRGRLWQKGETSGHVLRLRGLALDCDRDALLITAEAAGPTCHTGARSCFDEGGAARAGDGAGPAPPVDRADAAPDSFAWLDVLWSTIADRAARRPAGSYTVRLLDGGVDAVGRKLVEEATEVLMAAKDDAVAEREGHSRPRDALSAEVADLLYHELVLLAERGLTPGDVISVLRSRHAR